MENAVFLFGHNGLAVGAGGLLTLASLVCLAERPLSRYINGPRLLPGCC